MSVLKSVQRVLSPVLYHFHFLAVFQFLTKPTASRRAFEPFPALESWPLNCSFRSFLELEEEEGGRSGFAAVPLDLSRLVVRVGS